MKIHAKTRKNVLIFILYLGYNDLVKKSSQATVPLSRDLLIHGKLTLAGHE
jgi:hypothetical protein